MNNETPISPDSNEEKNQAFLNTQLPRVTRDNLQNPDSILIIAEGLRNEFTRLKTQQHLQGLNPDVHKDFRAQQKKLALPYYKEAYGKEIIHYVLDPMIADGKPKKFDGVDAKRWRPATIESKVRQAWEYVRDNLDPDKKYAMLFAKTEVCRKGDTVVILFKSPDVPLRPSDYKEFSTYEDVIKVIKDIIENEIAYPFDRKYIIPTDWDDMEPFSLSTEEIKKVEDFCTAFNFIIINAAHDKISVLKFTPKTSEPIVEVAP